MKKTINVGIIGWGFMGRTHAHCLREMGLFYQDADFRVRIAGVCSRRLEKAEEAAGELGCDFFTDDYRALLERSDIDAVSICTPNAEHEKIALAAIASGKHVYIDKPLSVTAESARRIADAAKSADIITRMVFNNRYFPATMRAKQLSDEGRLGNILSFSGRYLHSGSIDPQKPIGWKQQGQGGVLLDLGSHIIDLITWICGYPEAVFCAERTLYAARPVKGGGMTDDISEDQALITMRLKNGALGQIEASKIATGANDDLSFEIRGDKGAIMFDAMQPNYLMYYDNTLPERPLGGDRGFTRIETVARYAAPGGAFLPPKNSVGWDRGHMHCYFTFLDDVAHARKGENGIEDGARLQTLMEIIDISAREGRWLDTSSI